MHSHLWLIAAISLAATRHSGLCTFSGGDAAARTTDSEQLMAPTIFWADYDRDGNLDALGIYATGEARLFRNMGDDTFADVTDATGLSSTDRSDDADWVDYNRDGQLDLYFSANRTVRRLFQNNGEGRFEDMTVQAGLAEEFGNAPAEWMDFNNDRFPDLVVLTALGDRVFRNVGGSAFDEVVFGPMIIPSAPVASNAADERVLGDDSGAGEFAPQSHNGETRRPRFRQAPTQRFDVRPAMATGTTVGTGSGGTFPLVSTCPTAIRDQSASGGCMEASSTPMLGRLFPMDQRLNVDSVTGRVGIGTTTPVTPLHVSGVSGSPVVAIGAGQGGIYGGLGFTTAASNRVWLTASGAEDMTIDTQGRVGVGTPLPTSRLSIRNLSSAPIRKLLEIQDLNQGGDAGTSLHVIGDSTGINLSNSWAALSFGASAAGATNVKHLNIATDGNVGVGTTTPASKLTVRSQSGATSRRLFAIEDLNAAGNGGTSLLIDGDASFGINMTNVWAGLSFGASGSGTANVKSLTIATSGNVGIGVASPTEKLDVGGATRTQCLRITGGCDIVEGFDTGVESCEPGTVVVIDRERPGELKKSGESYDRTVAGVVSGANGVKPGVELSQVGILEGRTSVAMAGRVYVKCSTENGAIEPGDLLTTSSIAGHAMRASDFGRCQGAVLGKAMSRLDRDTGLVLVLVNLQ